MQENYVATFDRNRAHSLHLFEHVHGESRDRGQAMVDLLETYRQHGFEPVVSELPDHVPLFLEFLGVIDPAVAQDLLDDAIHVRAAIGSRLARNESPYASVFVVLRGLSPVSYTHLDVYKRQASGCCGAWWWSTSTAPASCCPRTSCSG